MYNTENSKVINVDIENEMKKSFMDYSMSVIASRALPDVRDGLKPVHRRIIYTMDDAGNTSDKPYRKCAYTVGEVLGKYHPHGDASVYDALVRLAQNFSLRYPLIDGHGNFGSTDGDPPAAYRYTEARMAKIAGEMLADIGKDTIPYRPNYDDHILEPEVLPSRFPNLLVNGSIGIAVGMATNIPPHNLREVIDAINAVIADPEISYDKLMDHIKGPDFPTGGIIMGRAGIRSAYATGRGKITLRARTEIEEIKGRPCIIVTEIPYMVNKARLVEAIAALAKEKRVDGIHFVRDESDKEHDVRIVIELKKEAAPNIVLNKLFAYTQLQETVGVIMLALVRGEPKILTLRQMLDEYVDFQVEVIRRRTEFDLKKARERAHILEGLMTAVDNIDEVVKICRTSKDASEIKSRLIERFGISEIQADAIAQMRLVQLSGLERQKLEDELNSLHAKIEEYLEVLGSHEKILAIISAELEVIKNKYGDERRTAIENVTGEVDDEDLIPEESCVVTYTDIGYIKRQPVAAYKTQNRGGKGVSGMKQRDEDFVQEMFISSSHDNILFITNKGIMYKLRCFEIPEGAKQARGRNIVNILPMGEGESVAAMLNTSDFSEGKYVIMVTKNGKIKRTSLAAYKNVRKNGLIAIGLDEGDEIASVVLTEGSAQLIIATENGMAIRIEEEKVRALSRSAHGVKAITLKDGDRVVSMAMLRQGAEVLTVTDKGFGRRSLAESYRIQNRGGFGLLNYKASEEKGKVCGVRVVNEDEDVIMISADGIIIRIRVSDIRIMGRYATGVRLMRISEGGSVAAFTSAEHDESAETAKVEEPDEAEIAEAEKEEKAEILPQDVPESDE